MSTPAIQARISMNYAIACLQNAKVAYCPEDADDYLRQGSENIRLARGRLKYASGRDWDRTQGDVK